MTVEQFWDKPQLFGQNLDGIINLKDYFPKRAMVSSQRKEKFPHSSIDLGRSNIFILFNGCIILA